MAGRFRVVITPEAQQDLRDIYSYIRRSAPKAAAEWSSEIRQQMKTLARQPYRCHLAPESSHFHEDIRELLHGKGNRGTYRILFTILSKTVFVLHVRHGSRLEMTS